MKIILFTGLSGSGKSTIANRVGEGLGLPVVNFHQIVHGLANSKGFKRTRDWVYSNGIERVLAESRTGLISAVEIAKNEKGVIIDEVLDPQTLALLKESFSQDEFLTVYIRVSRGERKHWLAKNSEGNKPAVAIREMRHIDYLKEKAGIREIIEGANIRIENFRGIDEVTTQLIERLIKEEVPPKLEISREREI